MNPLRIEYQTDFDDLCDRGKALSSVYAGNHPFPHIVLDDFFNPADLEKVLGEVDRLDRSKYYEKFMGNLTEHKKFAFLPHQVGTETSKLINYLNSGIFIAFLEKLTGIAALLPDPSYVGAGVHWIDNGGFLEVHADFRNNVKYNLERRLNLLLYLNKDWDESYGGSLELWDVNSMSKEQSIQPVFNRCVIFSTTKEALHGHPSPLNHPRGVPRRSLALYYYTNTWNYTETKDNTNFYTTTLNLRAVGFSGILREAIHNVTPPIVNKTSRALKRLIKNAIGGAQGK